MTRTPGRAVGFEYWIDDECWDWSVRKARRRLVGIIYDTIGPEVTKNLASGFQHANRTTTSSREEKLFADLHIDVSSAENKRALAARDEILHNGYFLKRWRDLTPPGRQERRDDVARVRRLTLLIIFRLTGFDGEFLDPIRLTAEKVSAVTLPTLIAPVVTPNNSSVDGATGRCGYDVDLLTFVRRHPGTVGTPVPSAYRSLYAPDEKPCERTVVRVAWLIARFARREFVDIDRYHERFGVSLRTFRRDLALLRDARMYVEAHPTRGYKLPWFGPSIDAG